MNISTTTQSNFLSNYKQSYIQHYINTNARYNYSYFGKIVQYGTMIITTEKNTLLLEFKSRNNWFIELNLLKIYS